MRYRTVPWNGSKRWMETPLREVFSKWDGKGRFYDPFCGSGFVSALMREVHPNTTQTVGDVNPWLVGFLRRQIECQKTDEIPSPGLTDVPYWRSLADPTILGVNEQAARFLICLLTSWGARYQDHADGTFGLPIQTEKGRYNQAVGTLPELWRTFWLRREDTVRQGSWADTIADAKQGDLVFLDPPYTETMGYGVEWTVADQMDVLFWAAEATQRGVQVVATNHDAIGRYYDKFGLSVEYLNSPARGRTSKLRREMLAVSPSLDRQKESNILDLFGE